MAIEQQSQFLESIPPFDRLSNSVLQEVASQMDVVYFPVDSVVEVNRRESAFLYFIIKGRVAEYQEGDLVTQYAIRSYFGEQAVLSADAEQDVREFKVLEESILYRLPVAVFTELLETQPLFKQHFQSTIVEKLDALHQSMQLMTSTEVMMDTVCSAPIKPLVLLDGSVTLQQAVERMVEVQSDACVVDLKEAVYDYGIVTSTDILKIIAAGDFNERAVLKDFANGPLITVHEFDYLFNALLKMTKFQIDRLAVRSDEGLIGFLSQKDLMGLFANQSGLALIKIDQAESVGDFKRVAEQIDDLVVNLQRKGIKTHYIAKLVNELHRKLMAKLFSLYVPSSIQDKITLLVMGSEGRSEQVLRTDQDNAILFNGLSEEEQVRLAQSAKEFSHALIEIGFPPCKGEIMVSNPMWRQSIADFSFQLKNWFDRPSEDGFMYISILYDAQTITGEEAMLAEVQDVLFKRLRDNPVFLRHFAKTALQFETPIGFFGGLRTDKSGGQERIDLKKSGIFPIVHGVRCYALEAGLRQTNTHWRIKALMDAGVLEQDFGIELGETLNYFHGLRLGAMLQQRMQGRKDDELDNFIDLQNLSHLQQDLLKQAFTVVDDFKRRLQKHFKLHEVM